MTRPTSLSGNIKRILGGYQEDIFQDDDRDTGDGDVGRRRKTLNGKSKTGPTLKGTKLTNSVLLPL